MKLNVFGQQYTVKFRHFLDGKKVTTCDIIAGEIIFGSGAALCSEKDQFNRARGRKIAFARAVKAFNRNEREAFWKAAWLAKEGKTEDAWAI